jgi:hypothetical protein
MNYSDPKVRKLVSDFQDHLGDLVEKFYESTGHNILIGYGMEDEEGTISGAVGSKELEYTKAAQICSEITHFVIGYYEDDPEPWGDEAPLVP